MALRACVARWKRLPRNLSMDNGPGFRNASLQLLLKYYDDIHPEWRKIESPRGGSLVERFGGSTNQRIANELPGGTKVLNRHRGRLSKTHDPIQLAVHSLMDAADTLVEWANDTYDKLPHAGLNGRSPRDVREESLREHGERKHLTIQLDDTFLIMSLPAPEGDGTLKVQAHDGVQVDGFLYWNKDAFESPGVEGSRVQVRYDPFNITHVYAFVCGVWVVCKCRKLERLKRLSPEHLCMLTIEIRRRKWGYYHEYTEVTKLVRAFINGKAKTQQELEDILRAKQSSTLAIRNFPGVDLGDLDDDAEAGEASIPQPPIPGLPGGNANPHEYKELS